MLGYISMNRFGILFGFRARWKQIFPGACTSSQLQYRRDCCVLPLLIANLWIILCHFSFTFCIDILHLCCIGFCVCFFVCHVCLRVTMTDSDYPFGIFKLVLSMQGNISGYLPRSVIWIGSFFVYITHATKYVLRTNMYIFRTKSFVCLFI
jgi:hypothetical protein